MRKILTLAAASLFFAFPSTAQEWSIGVHSGAYIFGDFVERTLRATTGQDPSGATVLILTADTQPGFAFDIEKEFAPRWAVRLEGTFTSAPLAVREEGTDDDEVSINAGDADIATFTVPLVFRINPRGAFRFHIMGGPAYAVYRISSGENASGITPFDETRSEWGLMAGGGVAWWVGERFAVEGNFSDVSTASPFKREDFRDVPGYRIPRPHNIHTTVGVRWRF